MRILDWLFSRSSSVSRPVAPAPPHDGGHARRRDELAQVAEETAAIQRTLTRLDHHLTHVERWQQGATGAFRELEGTLHDDR